MYKREFKSVSSLWFLKKNCTITGTGGWSLCAVCFV